MRASIIEVGQTGSTVSDMTQAIQEAREKMAQDDLVTTLHNIVIITDRNVSEIGTADEIDAFGTEAKNTKNAGVKITIINAGGDTQWTQYASDDGFVFNEENFDEKLPSWHIQRSLCQGK